MTLYTYVPGKEELLDLMLDQLFMEIVNVPWNPEQDWRARLSVVAEFNRQMYGNHAWATRVSTTRPPFGPGMMAKYEHELAAFDGLTLDPIEIDMAWSS